jgi:murein L,D-transpeptidase YcbB/YkuD
MKYVLFRSAVVLLAVAGSAGQATSAAKAAKSAHGPKSATDAQAISTGSLKAAASEKSVRSVYAALGWRKIWTSSDASSLADVLKTRRRNALERFDFGQSGEGATPAEQDVAKTKAALRYASALADGAIDPSTLHDVYTLARPDTDVGAGLVKALQQGNLVEWFASLAPQDDHYRQLSKAYVDYSTSNANGPDIGSGAVIQVGDSDPRVPEIVAQLTANGYLPAGAADHAGSSYTQAISDAVKHLQSDYGIKDDGVVGPDTLSVLNTGPAIKARALAVALERRRWLVRNPPATRIDVNTAAATLDYYQDGKLVDERKVIVGKPGKETPALGAPFYRLVANPTWTVPKSIQHSSLSNVGPAYMKAHNMVWKGGYIVQQPGPDNALGLVKFDMKDNQEIYLHDTGTPSLFDRSQRHLSHGCVRVDDALGFAKMIAKSEGISKQWDDAHGLKKQTFVDLPHEIPVRLLYWNTFVDSKGDVAFRTDPYGWNDAVAKKLGFGDNAPKTAKVSDIDIGP